MRELGAASTSPRPGRGQLVHDHADAQGLTGGPCCIPTTPTPTPACPDGRAITTANGAKVPFHAHLERDGGHENLPVGGHRNSPLTATGSDLPMGGHRISPRRPFCPERPVAPRASSTKRVEEAGLKKAEEVMEILEAFDLGVAT
jgi:hypothetical protein